MVSIHYIFNLNKKILFKLIFTRKLNKSIINIAIISANAHCVTSKLKQASVFIIFIINLEF